MDTKQLMTFLTLAETLNYQRAAERLQYAPSSLFRHIQMLEEELGTPLFYKNGRQLELTEDGRRLLPGARDLLSEYRAFLSSAQESENVRAVAVGGCEMNTSYSLFDLLHRFSVRCPDTHYSMTTSPNAAVPDLLRAGLIDVGFYYSTAPRRPQGLSHIPLYREPLFPCTAPGHPLRDQPSVSWDSLSSLPVIHPHDNCCFMTEYRGALRSRGLAVGRASFLGGISLVMEQARRDQALLLIPSHALPRLGEEFGVKPLSLVGEPLFFWESVLYRNSEELSPSARRLIRFAVKFATGELAAHPDTLTGPASFDPYLSAL